MDDDKTSRDSQSETGMRKENKPYWAIRLYRRNVQDEEDVGGGQCWCR